MKFLTGPVGAGCEQYARQTKSDKRSLRHQYTRAFGWMYSISEVIV